MQTQCDITGDSPAGTPPPRFQDRLRLPLAFDSALLAADLRRLHATPWIDHFVPQNYHGDWSVIPLRAQAGARHPVQMIYSEPGATAFVDTPYLAQCPAFRTVIDSFSCPLQAVRLMRLTPGSIIREHCDNDLSFEHGSVRFHVPVTTNDSVMFELNRRRVVLEAGSCWYLRLSDPHQVANFGDSDRVHLVIDATVNEWVEALFVAAGAPTMTSAAASLAPFRALVEADASLQEKLAGPDDPVLFIALAVAAARQHGIDLDAEHLATQLHSPRQILADDGSLARLPPKGWLPVRARWQEQELYLDWSYVGPHRLREPFFGDTVARCMAKPLNRLLHYTTPIGALADWLQQHPGLPPTGFVFHMSRCGSTLVSQMLASLPDNVVVSEASPIDAVVQARTTLPDLHCDRHAQWLRWIIGALGQQRTAERHLFVKLDAWHSLMLPLFRRTFPDVPWIFLYRDPVEVLVSQLRQRGTHTVPGLVGGDVFGLDAAAAALAPEQMCAHVLGRICDGALRAITPDKALLVNYRQLPAALCTDILPHFGRGCSASDRAAMAQAARHDAKRPDRVFRSDSAAKQLLATDEIQSAAAQLGGLYARLEAVRLAC